MSDVVGSTVFYTVSCIMQEKVYKSVSRRRLHSETTGKTLTNHCIAGPEKKLQTFST